ncbi:FAD-dependent monooxygenase [Pseudorhodoplanes sp.]|uniref:FAD-dependent monooxygenase n=1 Tax=Pseudorhodoplanes sp. TaxID=1934341 RepID=UPI00391DE5F9
MTFGARIAVVGGGPAGLLFAKLVARENPAYQVHVYEQNPPDATYGFGIVLADVALDFLRGIDEGLHCDLLATAERQDTITLYHRGTAVPIRGNVFLGIPRVRLLNIMQAHAQSQGVTIEYTKRIERLDALADYDLIVGADGVNSAVRNALQTDFQAVVEPRINKWAWYGTRHRFDTVELIFEQTPYGIFIAHSYRYAPDFGTFVIECHPDTWQRAGLDTKTDDESRRFCGQIFEAYLDGEELISNRSVWFNPSFVTSKRWFSGKVVLIGDALKTVHPSIGSGTRMAFEDATALAQAINSCGGDFAAGLVAFENARRPVANGFQDAAMKSILWYESADTRQHLTPLEFAYSYMMRTGKVDRERLRKIDPEFLAAYEAETKQRIIMANPSAQSLL